MEKKLNKAEGYRKLLKIVVTLLVLIGLLGMMYSDEVKPNCRTENAICKK